jgi:energy-coupling factor transporter ATP-binding protein EcfA2
MIKSDEPITSADQDVLGRARVASVIAREIRGIEASQGSVVGILGPWGSGKTSLLNLVRVQLAAEPEVATLEFNPWLFSGVDQLVDRFFAELSAQLRLGPGALAGIADALDLYGKAVAPLTYLPMVGFWFQLSRGVGKAFKALIDRRKKGVAEVRNRLSERLSELEVPIVVVVDDIDRLRTDEIRDIFKLVRLTASFPNIIYLVAFDRARVESALADDGLPGRDYLEKILQVAYDIPAIPDRALNSQITNAIDEALDGVDAGFFDEQRWPDVFVEVIRPLIRNMRDVRRYAASLRGAVIGLERRVDLVDVLGLEAIRVFLPDVFARLPAAAEALTSTDTGGYAENLRDSHFKRAIDDLISLIDPTDSRSGVIRSMIERMFPAGLRHVGGSNYGRDWLATWLRARRVAHLDILNYYLQRVAGDRLEAAWLAERAFGLLADQQALDEFLRSVEPKTAVEDVVAALEDFQKEYPKAAALPATVVLLNLLPELPERKRGTFDLSSSIVVGRVVLRLLRKLPTPADVEATVRAALPQIRSLGSRLALLTLVGHRQGAGHKLVGEEVAAEMEGQLREQVKAATPERLSAERDILNLLLWTLHTAAGSEPVLLPSTDVQVVAAILKGAVHEAVSQSVGSRALARRKQLNWEALTEVFRDESQIQKAVDLASDPLAADSNLAEATALAKKYLAGWRPSDFPEDEDADPEALERTLGDS